MPPPGPPAVRPWPKCPNGTKLEDCPQWKACLSDPAHCVALDLSGSGLTGTIPPEVGTLNATQELLLHDNLLSGTIPHEIGGMTSLAWMLLHNNKFTGAGDGICSIAGPHAPVKTLRYACSLMGNLGMNGESCPLCLEAGACNTKEFPLPGTCTRNTTAGVPPPAPQQEVAQQQEQEQVQKQSQEKVSDPNASAETAEVDQLASAAAVASAATGTAHTPSNLSHHLHLPFSWDTLPRYTFCGNASGLLNAQAASYISEQGGPIFLIGDHSSYRYPAEDTIAAQANAMRALNPQQQFWAYILGSTSCGRCSPPMPTC